MSYAESFEVNGIYYRIVSTSNPSCEVSNCKITGEINIPSKVVYNNKEFSVISIGKSAFYQLKGVSSVIIPNSVTDIKESAFNGCYLSSVTIPNSVTSIERGAFYKCKYLTSVTIPNSVTTIGERAFSGCMSLSSVIIPNGVTHIGARAFEYCSNLNYVSIPNSVKNIGYNAFFQIKGEKYYWDNNSFIGILAHRNLQYLELGENVSQAVKLTDTSLNTLVNHSPKLLGVDSSFFYDSQYETVKVFVPSSLLKEYQQSEVWKKFWNLEGGAENMSIFNFSNSTIVELISTDEDVHEVSRYNLQGMPIGKNEKGIQIIVYSNESVKTVIVE